MKYLIPLLLILSACNEKDPLTPLERIYEREGIVDGRVQVGEPNAEYRCDLYRIDNFSEIWVRVNDLDEGEFIHVSDEDATIPFDYDGISLLPNGSETDGPCVWKCRGPGWGATVSLTCEQ